LQKYEKYLYSAYFFLIFYCSKRFILIILLLFFSLLKATSKDKFSTSKVPFFYFFILDFALFVCLSIFFVLDYSFLCLSKLLTENFSQKVYFMKLILYFCTQI